MTTHQQDSPQSAPAPGAPGAPAAGSGTAPPGGPDELPDSARSHGDRDRIDDPVPAARQVLEGRHGPERFLDREASWVAFNSRVLELAEDPDLFLLDRKSVV